MLINDISYFFIIIYEMYICNVFIKKKISLYFCFNINIKCWLDK